MLFSWHLVIICMVKCEDKLSPINTFGYRFCRVASKPAITRCIWQVSFHENKHGHRFFELPNDVYITTKNLMLLQKIFKKILINSCNWQSWICEAMLQSCTVLLMFTVNINMGSLLFSSLCHLIKYNQLDLSFRLHV